MTSSLATDDPVLLAFSEEVGTEGPITVIDVNIEGKRVIGFCPIRAILVSVTGLFCYRLTEMSGITIKRNDSSTNGDGIGSLCRFTAPRMMFALRYPVLLRPKLLHAALTGLSIFAAPHPKRIGIDNHYR